MSILEIKHSPAPFDIRIEAQTAFFSSKGRPSSGCFGDESHNAWWDFAQFIVQMDGSERASPTGVANLNLFRAAPALLQTAIALVREHAKRGGVYDQILPADQQPSLVREAMGAVEAALSGELP